jgi:hypothetical protein
VKIESIEYHSKNGDLANWLRTSLGDDRLADQLDSLIDLRGEGLREKLLKIIATNLKDLC